MLELPGEEIRAENLNIHVDNTQGQEEEEEGKQLLAKAGRLDAVEKEHAELLDRVKRVRSLEMKIEQLTEMEKKQGELEKQCAKVDEVVAKYEAMVGKASIMELVSVGWSILG